jgi:hypothetical protein
MINDAAEGDLPETRFYTDFTMAGRDAFAVVAFLVFLWKECKINALDLQISAFPVPNSMMYIADAAAVKVCSLDVYLIEYLRTFLRRRSPPIVTDFLNPYFDISC